MKQIKGALLLSVALGVLSTVVGLNASPTFTMIILLTAALLALIIMVVLPSSEEIRTFGLGALVPMLLLSALTAAGPQSVWVYFAVSSLLGLVTMIAFGTSMSLEAAYIRGLQDAREGHQFTEMQVKAMFRRWNETSPIKWNGNSRAGSVTGKVAIAMILNGKSSGQPVRQAEAIFIQWQQMKARGQHETE